MMKHHEENQRRERDAYYGKKNNWNNQGSSRSSSSGGKWFLYLLPVLGFYLLYNKYGNKVIVIIAIIALLVITFIIIRIIKKHSSNQANMSFTGRKKETFSDGVYEGDYVNGYRHGKGKMILNNGIVYEGDFVEDKCQGKGKLVLANGASYEGDFVNDYFNGKGKLVYENGDVYEGDYFEDKWHGKGKFTWSNGDVYEGDFLNDNFHGNGKIIGSIPLKLCKHGVSQSETPVKNKKTRKGLFVFRTSPRGIDFQSQTSCLLLPVRLRAPRRILRRLLFKATLSRWDFLQECFGSIPLNLSMHGVLLRKTPRPKKEGVVHRMFDRMCGVLHNRNLRVLLAKLPDQKNSSCPWNV